MRATHYKIAATALLLATSTGIQAFSINLDYSLDANDFFGDSSSSRRVVMDAAASFFESRLTDDFTAITSAGTNSMTATFFNPATGDEGSKTNFSVAANTITVFVGGRDLGGSTLGRGGYGGWSASGSDPFLETIRHRGESGLMYNTTDTSKDANEFNPWGGSISFDTDSSWYFDSDPSTTEGFSGIDFYSVALHELGHVLGLGTADSWDNLINGSDQFTGPNSTATHGGNVPLESDGAHWKAGTGSFVDGLTAQEAAMDPNIAGGQRKYFTDLDMAALDDIGWNVAAVPLPPALLLFGSGLLGFLGLRRHQQTRA
jgi:hypothetical protein